MHNEHLGYVMTCPSNLGTGLRVSYMVKIPLVSARKDFMEACSKMKLQASGSGDTWEISNAERLGKSET